MMDKKLLLVGTNSIHTFNYLKLVEGYFDDVFIITDGDCSTLKNYKHCKVDFSIKNPFSVIRSLRKLKQSINSFVPTVIHVHQVGTTSLFAILANKKKYPLVLTAWGSDVLHTPNKNFLYYKLAKHSLRKATSITADSAFMGDEIRKIVKNKKLKVLIANFGIDIEDKNIEKENIIYSNRLHKNFYRIDKIIAAFSKFVKKYDNWKLVIAGSGEETENLKKQAYEIEIDDKVQFVGWLEKEQNMKYYQRSKVFVSVPISDGTAISLLEAMGCGCIPVVYSLPSSLEWVKNGDNGIVVDELDHNFLDNIFNLDIDNAIYLNRKIIEEKGTKEVNRKMFTDLYETLIK